MRVYIGVGHGGKDPGACAYGNKEKDFALDVCKKMVEILAKSVDAKISRTNDMYKSVTKKVQECNGSSVDLALDIHFNAGGGKGIEVYYYSSNKKMRDLAEHLCDEQEKVGVRNRGAKTGDHLYFVRNTEMDAILIEVGFMDNKEDLIRFDSKEKREKIASQLAHSILSYYKIPNVQFDKRIKYRVQLGAYAEKDNAEKMLEELKKHGFKGVIKNAE